MKQLFRGGRRKVAAVMAVALIASLSQVAPSNAAPSAKKAGGSITVGVFNSLLSSCFSPNAANSALGIMKTVYEGWFEKNKDGKIVPYLAEAFTPSADFKSWTVKIRPGIKFHDGTTLDAAAAVANITATQGTYYLAVTARGGNARHTLSSGIPFIANLKAVTALSTDTFRLDLWNGQVDFPETIYASGRNFIRAVSDLTNATQCVTSGKGTGPFMFKSISPTEVVVTKNPNYWRKDKQGEQLPYLDQITFKYVNQASQRVKGLQSGALDAAQFTSAGEVKQILSVQADKNLQIIDSGFTYYPMTILNTAIEPFNNKNARLAVAHAFDIETFYKQRQCFKGKCVGQIGDSMVGKTNIMYNKQGFIKYDLKKAKEYVAAYKAETGKDLTFTQPADTSAEAQASAKTVAQIMKKAGITMNILTEDTATITAKAFPTPGTGFNTYQAYPTLLFEGQDTAFVLPFMPSNMFTAPNNLFVAGLRAQAGALAAGTFLAFGAVINPGRTSDKALDALVWDAWYDTTAARGAKLKAVTKYYQENAFSIHTPYMGYLTGMSSKLKGWDKFFLASGGQGIPMTNAGINYTGLYLEK
ncbi:MAG: ABC transporter substrate-binding protein [Actinobacteria bacterium]|nr:ABC transporter substrate-binding protein [Actinomycetota bacterium]